MNPWRIRRLETTASTNDDVKNAAEAGEAEGLVIHALSQSSGRGRHGRSWQSPEGNLYCSVLLRPPDARYYAHSSFVASLALADTVHALVPHAKVTLKWPNDVLADGKKIGGILLEAGEGYLVVGMGLNIRHHPEDAMYPATSLQAVGARESDIDRVLETLLHRLRHWHEILQKQGFAPVRAAWLERAQKGRLRVRLPRGAVEGDFKDLDGEGRLVLGLADGAERVIATGDVFFAQE